MRSGTCPFVSRRFLAGFCYTQLTDTEQEIDGLLTYRRESKAPPEQVSSLIPTCKSK